MLDTTIIATLTTPISSEFKSLSLLSWLASAYLIANAACQPVAGKLTDIFSRRTGLIFSNVFFGAGCLICGLAGNEWVMITGRVVSGIGGGGLTAISTFVSSDLVPLRTRGIWQGYGNVVFGLGMSVGGVVGGWFNDTVGWRWAFLMQVPFTVVSGLLVTFLVNVPVKETGKSAWKRVDYRGAALLTLSLVLLLLGVNTGGNQFPWNHPLVVTALPLSIVFMLLFVYVEDKIAPEPIIPIRLLLRRTVWAACFTNVFSTMSVFIVFFYVPFYLQISGHSATQAGLRLIPQAFATSIGSIGAGLVMRMTGRYYWMNCITMTILIAGAALICTLNFSSSAWQTYVYLIPGGFGYGGMLTITLVALIAAVDHEHQAVITSALCTGIPPNELLGFDCPFNGACQATITPSFIVSCSASRPSCTVGFLSPPPHTRQLYLQISVRLRSSRKKQVFSCEQQDILLDLNPAANMPGVRKSSIHHQFTSFGTAMGNLYRHAPTS